MTQEKGLSSKDTFLEPDQHRQKSSAHTILSGFVSATRDCAGFLPSNLQVAFQFQPSAHPQAL